MLAIVTALGAAVGVAAFKDVFAGIPSIGPTAPDLFKCLREPISYSCENKTEIANTCCLPTQGLVLSTQFWNTHTRLESTGQVLPKGAWTLHGLWPDNCDGSYEAYCDLSRQFDPKPDLTNGHNVTVPPWTGASLVELIAKFGRDDLVAYANKYWIGYNQESWILWAHEYSKHATCFSTFDTKCYKNYEQYEDIVNYLDTAIFAYKKYPTFRWLAAAGIVPSNSTTYARADVLGALEAASGALPRVACTADGFLSEVWYYAHSLGAPQVGIFKPLPTTFGTNCPETVKYPLRSEGSEK